MDTESVHTGARLYLYSFLTHAPDGEKGQPDAFA
jgi:hypothetical protein